MPYNIPGETPEITQKMERCVSSVMDSKYIKDKYTGKQKKSHAIAICKAQIGGKKLVKKELAKQKLEKIKLSLKDLKKSDLNDIQKDVARRKLLFKAKELLQLSKEDLEVGENMSSDKVQLEGEEPKKEDKITKEDSPKDTPSEDKKDEELTDEEKSLTEEEMLAIETELDIDGVELEVEEETVEKEEKKNEPSSEDKKEEENPSETEDTKSTEDAPEESKEDTDKNDVETKEEEPKEETKEEETKGEEKPAKETPKEEKTELSKDLLINIRGELAKAYNELKNKESEVLRLQKELTDVTDKFNSINDEKVQLSKELIQYKDKEAEMNKTAFEKRIQLLSDNYAKIGQQKSVENLSKLSLEVIDELENVVKLAMQSQDGESIVIPSQSMGDIKKEEVAEEKIQLSKADSKDFFRHVAKTLETQRNAGKRIINV